MHYFVFLILLIVMILLNSAKSKYLPLILNMQQEEKSHLKVPLHCASVSSVPNLQICHLGNKYFFHTVTSAYDYYMYIAVTHINQLL